MPISVFKQVDRHSGRCAARQRVTTSASRRRGHPNSPAGIDLREVENAPKPSERVHGIAARTLQQRRQRTTDGGRQKSIIHERLDNPRPRPKAFYMSSALQNSSLKHKAPLCVLSCAAMIVQRAEKRDSFPAGCGNSNGI